MSSTAHEISFGPASAPPTRPDPAYLRPVGPQQVEDEGLGSGSSDRTESPDLDMRPSGQPVQRPSSGPLGIEVDPEGTYVVRDLLGAVYGAGGSIDEARAEFFAALDDHLAYLREHRAELSPRLLQQCLALERLFPGR